MANAPFDPFGDRKNDGFDDLGEIAQDILRELKNASDIVLDAASATKDEMLRSVGESVRSVRDAAKEARSNYSSEFKAAEAEFARQRQQRKESPPENRGKSKFRPVSKGAGFLMAPVAALGVPGGVLSVISLIQQLSGNPEQDVATVALVLLSLAALPFGLSLGKKRKEKLYTRYLEAIGTAPSVNLRVLSTRMKRKYDKCVEDLRDMLSRGYFGEGARLDLRAGELILDEAAANALREQQARQQQEQQAKAEKPAEGYEAMLTELQQLNALIEDEAMSEQITRIETVARATFLAVEQKPEKSSQLRRFMDYYLPTTIKLLRSYAGFERSTVQGENIRRSKENIEGMMQTLCEAFEKQYDSLFLSETMDINAEIQTMDTLLRQDGYVGGASFGSAFAKQEQEK